MLASCGGDSIAIQQYISLDNQIPLSIRKHWSPLRPPPTAAADEHNSFPLSGAKAAKKDTYRYIFTRLLYVTRYIFWTEGLGHGPAGSCCGRRAAALSIRKQRNTEQTFEFGSRVALTQSDAGSNSNLLLVHLHRWAARFLHFIPSYTPPLPSPKERAAGAQL